MDWWIVFFGLALWTVQAQSSAAKPETYVMCKSQSNVRTIRVEAESSAGVCTTTYTKEGVDRVVGSSRSLKSCRGYLDNIRDNLEDAAWKCRDISSTEIAGPVTKAE